MPISNQVVVHFTNGRLLKGTTQDFNPSRMSFHVQPADGSPAVEVECQTMKALFFVKDLKGDPKRLDRADGFNGTGPNAQGKRVAVHFSDGETLFGYSLTYVPGRDGFFVFPADPGTNNLRVFVVKGSTVEIKTDADAVKLAERTMRRTGNSDRPGLSSRRRSLLSFVPLGLRTRFSPS